MPSSINEMLGRIVAKTNQLSIRVGKYEARHDGRIVLPADNPDEPSPNGGIGDNTKPIEWPEPSPNDISVAEAENKHEQEAEQSDKMHADDETDEPSAEQHDEEARHDALSSTLDDLNDMLARFDDAAFEAKHPRGPDGKFGSGGGAASLKPDPSKYNKQRAAYISARIKEVEAAGDDIAKLKEISAGIKAGHGKTKVWIDALIAEKEAGAKPVAAEADDGESLVEQMQALNAETKSIDVLPKIDDKMTKKQVAKLTAEQQEQHAKNLLDGLNNGEILTEHASNELHKMGMYLAMNEDYSFKVNKYSGGIVYNPKKEIEAKPAAGITSSLPKPGDTMTASQATAMTAEQQTDHAEALLKAWQYDEISSDHVNVELAKMNMQAGHDSEGNYVVTDKTTGVVQYTTASHDEDDDDESDNADFDDNSSFVEDLKNAGYAETEAALVDGLITEEQYGELINHHAAKIPAGDKSLSKAAMDVLNEEVWVKSYGPSTKEKIGNELKTALSKGTITNEQYGYAIDAMAVSKALEKKLKSGISSTKTESLTFDPNIVQEIGNWKKIGEKQGSNPGGTFEAPNGTKYYAKNLKTQDHVDSEVAANQLYEAMGINTLKPQKATMNGKASIMSPIAKVGKFNPNDDAQKAEAQKQFIAHALLGNWDAAGASYDNLGTIDGKMTVLDAGGSLSYRAQGQKKTDADWGNDVKELQTLIDPSLNPNMAKVFGGMSVDQLEAAAKPVLSLSGKQIADICNATFANKKEAGAMAMKLMARQASIAGQIEAMKKGPQHPAPAAPTAALGKPAASDDSDYANFVLSTAPAAKLVQAGHNIHALYKAAGLPVPAPGYALSDQTKQFAESMQSYWPQALPKNKEKAEAQFNSIQAAMALADQAQPSGKSQLADIKPVVGSGATINAINDYLDKAKKDYGIATDAQTAEAVQVAVSKPAVAATIQKLKALPHKTIDHNTYLDDANGVEIKSVNKLSTKDIAGDWYAKASAVAASNKASHNSPHDTPAMHAMLDQYSKEHGYGACSQVVKEAVSTYQNGGYDTINKALRPGGSMTPKTQKLIGELDQSMKPLPCGFDTCYRGINASLKDITGFDDHEAAIGRCFEHHCYASIGRRESKSKSFAGSNGTMLKMSLPPGVKGCVMPNQAWETEFLLDRNSMFQIDKIEKIEGRTYVHCTYLGKREGA